MIPKSCSATLNAVSSLVRFVSFLKVVISTKSVCIVSMMVRKAIPSLQLGPKSFTFKLLSLRKKLFLKLFHFNTLNVIIFHLCELTYLGITVPTHFNKVFLAPSALRLISIVGDRMLSKLLVLPLKE